MVTRKPCIGCGIPVRATRCSNCASVLISTYKPKEKTTHRGYGADWQKLRRWVLDRDGWVCTNCQKKLVGSDATVDHVVPLSVDRSEAANDPKNLVAMCRSCNSRKGGIKK